MKWEGGPSIDLHQYRLIESQETPNSLIARALWLASYLRAFSVSDRFDRRRLPSGRFLAKWVPGRLAPQAVFPAHPGEWGHVNADPIPRGSLQGAMNDPSIFGAEDARHPDAPAIGGQGWPAVLGDGRLVGGDLGLQGRVGSGHRVLQVLEGSDDRGDLAGRDTGCREGGREIAAGGSARRSRVAALPAARTPEHAGPSVAQPLHQRRWFGRRSSTLSAQVSSDRLHSSEYRCPPTRVDGHPSLISVIGKSKRTRNSPETLKSEEFGSLTGDVRFAPHRNDRPHAPSA